MSAVVRSKGPWLHRFLIHFFTIILVILIYWTLSFLLEDIGEWSPNLQNMLATQVPAEASQRLLESQSRVDALQVQERQLQRQQAILQDSTASSQRTMNQMAELERLRLQKSEPAPPEQQQALAEAESQFLKNQREYQLKTEALACLEADEAQARLELATAHDSLQRAQAPVEREYERQVQRWRWRVAAVKVGMMLPLIVVSGWLFRRFRGGLYAPLVYGLGIAVGAKILVVMWEYFPALYFKYLLILCSLGVTVWLLVKLLRMIARPQADWLLKQYREAYASFLCPICEFPIRRGPLKYLSWTRSSLKRLAPPVGGAEPETQYSCPVCGTKLHEECPECHAIRHSLLPACCHCGKLKTES